MTTEAARDAQRMDVLMTAKAGTDLTDECRELHDALLHTDSVEQFLHEMAVLAARLVGGGLSCGMTMRSNGRPVTVACSDQVAAKVDEVQYELDDGPCLHAMRDGHVVRIEDTADKTSWPDFEAQAEPPSSEQLAAAWKPYIDTCIEAFGARRCMFESNFPVDKGSYSYAVGWNAFKRLAAGASAAEKAELFGGTATRFYRLGA